MKKQWFTFGGFLLIIGFLISNTTHSDAYPALQSSPLTMRTLPASLKQDIQNFEKNYAKAQYSSPGNLSQGVTLWFLDSLTEDDVWTLLDDAFRGTSFKLYPRDEHKITTLPVTPSELSAELNDTVCAGTLAWVELPSDQDPIDIVNKLRDYSKKPDLEKPFYPDPESLYSIKTAQVDPSKLLTSSEYLSILESQNRQEKAGKDHVIAILDTGVNDDREIPKERNIGGIHILKATDLSNSKPSTNDTYQDSYTDDQGKYVGHGTYVSILAAGSNQGVAPQAFIIPIRVCDDKKCSPLAITRGICHAISKTLNARIDPKNLIINLSLGGSNPTWNMMAAINLATSKKIGAWVVSAGGNTGVSGNFDEYPAAFSRKDGTSYSKNLAIASITREKIQEIKAKHPTSQIDQLNYKFYSSDFTTRAAYISMSAPGQGIKLTVDKPESNGLIDQYIVSGTSFAAAMVSGVLARTGKFNLKNLDCSPNTIPPFPTPEIAKRLCRIPQAR
jgi:Subtilase family